MRNEIISTLMVLIHIRSGMPIERKWAFGYMAQTQLWIAKNHPELAIIDLDNDYFITVNKDWRPNAQ